MRMAQQGTQREGRRHGVGIGVVVGQDERAIARAQGAQRLVQVERPFRCGFAHMDLGGAGLPADVGLTGAPDRTWDSC